MTKILIDTDVSLGTPKAEIDDGAALLALLNTSAEILGISTVYGNVLIEDVNSNLLRLLKYTGREDIPVAQGAVEALVEDEEWLSFLAEWQSQYGGTPEWDGARPTQSAVDLIIEVVGQNPGEVIILALGPLTNLALALQQSPKIVKQVKEVVMMGGSLNDVEEAEFNIRNDPEAAEMVLQAGWPIRMLGLEITRQALFTREDFADLQAGNPAVTLLQEQAKQWIPIVEAQGWETGGCSLHDAVAVAALFKPELFQFMPVGVEVITDSNEVRGAVQVEKEVRGSHIQMAVDIDAQACHAWIKQQIQGQIL
ncbi:MAG: nucleoside hydrolase [Chloroflexi bacterium]|nr:MAG: nucleoside hydrolase [Chloroflexota bacterium]MBL1194712.1 nucleoside hydrolase [Chloroflexota bacterium]NOH12005.1 nucleoside hydrolase [Chloroflexota bacterium]